jgi:hypothetical protein
LAAGTVSFSLFAVTGFGSAGKDGVPPTGTRPGTAGVSPLAIGPAGFVTTVSRLKSTTSRNGL